jgi:hypothetical protein
VLGTRINEILDVSTSKRQYKLEIRRKIRNKRQNHKKYIETVLFAATSRKRTPNMLFTGKQKAVSGRTAERTSEKDAQYRLNELIRERKNCNNRE